MRLDRNINPDGRGKFALIKLRVDQPAAISSDSPKGERTLTIKECAVDFGDTPDTDFFVIRLKDKFAAPALRAYAHAAHSEDPEYAKEIMDLANKAENHPHKQMPT